MSNDDAQVANSEEVDETTSAEIENEEVNQSQEPEDKSTSSDSEKSTLPDDPEALRREIAKLRKENAARRTKNKEIEDAAKKWQEHLDSQKTEFEKLQERLNTLEGENSTLKMERNQQALASEYGVDPDLVEFITGSDLDEMTAKAKKLAEKTAKRNRASAESMHAGRTSPVAQDSKQWLKDLFTDKG